MSEADVVLAPAKAVNAQLDKFASKLNSLKAVVSGINTAGIEKAADVMNVLDSRIKQFVDTAKSGGQTLAKAAANFIKIPVAADSGTVADNTATDFAQAEKANSALEKGKVSVPDILNEGGQDIIKRSKENLGESAGVVDSFFAWTQAMKENMEELGGIASKAANEYTGALKKIEDATGTLETIFNSTKTFNKVGALFNTNILPVFTKVKDMFALVSGGAGTLSEAFGAVFFTVSPVALVIGALVAVFAALYMTCEDFRAFVDEVVAGVAARFFEAVEVIRLKFVEIAGVIQTFIAQNQPIIDAFMAVVKAVFEIGFAGIGAIVSSTISGIQFVVSSFLDIIRVHIEIVLGVIHDIIHSFMEIFKGIIDVFMGIISGDWSKAWNGILEIFGGVWDLIYGTFNNIVSKIRGLFFELIGNAFTWGKDMIGGLINGIKSMFGAVGNAVKNIAGTISGFLHFSRPDMGPLRNYETWMPDFMQGLADGIGRSKSRVIDSLTALASEMTLSKPVRINGLVDVGAVFQENESSPVTMKAEANLLSANGSVAQDTAGAFYPLMYNAYVQAMSSVRGHSDVKVVLEADAGKIFRVVQTEAGRYTNMTGAAPFPV